MSQGGGDHIHIILSPLQGALTMAYVAPQRFVSHRRSGPESPSAAALEVKLLMSALHTLDAHRCIYIYVEKEFHVSLCVVLYLYTCYITLHYLTLHYITLHYITLHYITLHYIQLHYIASHYFTLHYITIHTYLYIHFA